MPALPVSVWDSDGKKTLVIAHKKCVALSTGHLDYYCIFLHELSLEVDFWRVVGARIVGVADVSNLLRSLLSGDGNFGVWPHNVILEAIFQLLSSKSHLLTCATSQFQVVRSGDLLEVNFQKRRI